MLRSSLLSASLWAICASSNAAPPSWWASQSATDGGLADDTAVLKQGQLKRFTSKAVLEMTERLPGGAGTELDALVAQWAAEHPDPDDAAPMVLGQLKWVAKLIHTRLVAVRYEDSLPVWLPATSNSSDNQLASLGQLKTVFNFDLTAPSGQLPEWWQKLHFNQTGISPDGDADADGLSNLNEYLLKLEPLLADYDGDGLPDGWEIQFGLDPRSVTGTNGGLYDSDGDGFNNIAEYYMGSSPSDPNSQPKGMVAAKGAHSIALTAQGRMWTWGSNSQGELGDGTETSRSSPVPVTTVVEMAKVMQVDAGTYFSVALDENGSLWAWGSNSSHQISPDETYRYKFPVRIEFPTPIARFACGSDYIIAVDRTGRLWSWGANGNGQLGLGHYNTVSRASEIVRPSAMGGIASLSASSANSYAVDGFGKIWSWGSNGYGQIGDNSSTTRTAPVLVDTADISGVKTAKSVTAGGAFVMALATDGAVWTWGQNSYGQLGSNNTTSKARPFKIATGLTNAKAVRAGLNHSLGISTTDFVWSWGRNSSGQLGINSTSSSYLPVQTSTVTDWSGILSVAGGDSHSIALKSDGSVWAWGLNGSGQLGLGDTTQRNTPTQLSGAVGLKLKLSNDDADADGLPDSWERYYFNSVAQTGSGVAIAGGVTNLVAYTRGLNPNTLDYDSDGLSNAVEITNGLDPVDWADASGDLDGDRIPNVWEYSMGSTMTDPSSKPSVMSTVASGQTIQAAVNAVTGNSGNPTWAVIQVPPGIYPGNISIPSDKRILLIPSNSTGIPEIQGTGTSATVSTNGECVIDGFRITHAKGITGTGVSSNSQKIVRVVNCMINGHTGSSGRGVNAVNGKLVLAHTNIFRNTGSTQGNGLYVGSGSQVLLLNSILWNSTGLDSRETYSDGVLEVRRSIIRGAPTLSGDPLINPIGLLTKASPARSMATQRGMTYRDIHGETRGTQPDIGADQFLDSDDDGLPDWLETLGVVSPTADNDTDGLLNLVEYEIHGTNLLNPDSDGDGLNDGPEAAQGTNPFDTDSDNDGMRDGWEVDYGLNPIDDRDALLDKDGDRIPNLWEYKRGTVPTNSGSRPNADVTVTATSPNEGKIQAAINGAPTNDQLANFYYIIQVNKGVYASNVSIPYNRKIVLLGELGYPLTEIKSAADSVYGVTISGTAFVDGFRISRAKDNDDSPYNGQQGIFIAMSQPNDQASLSNLIIHGHRAPTGAGILCTSGRVRLSQSTIYDTGSQSSGNAIYFNSTGSLDIQNCIIRATGGLAGEQIAKHASAVVSTSGSFITGGEYAGNPADPMLTPVGWLRNGSPAINAGSGPSVSRDIHGELRIGNPDAGADEFVDSDSDGLPNFIETLGATSPGIDNDNDSATNLVEYETIGTDLLVPDSDSDGLKDGLEVTNGTNPFDPDTDNDEMLDGSEVLYGLNPLSDLDALEDLDGDRIPNVYECARGFLPNSAASVPAPDFTIDPPTQAELDAHTNKIQLAINNSANPNRHTIIRVKAGNYPNTVYIDGVRILLLGDLGASLPVISHTEDDAVTINAKSAVLDGFQIMRKVPHKRQGLVVQTDLARDQARIVNSVITGFTADSGSAANVVKGRLTVLHCTIADNRGTVRSRAFEVGNSQLTLKNSIVWNTGGATGTAQIYKASSGTVSVTNSIILGGEFSGIPSAPLLDRYYCLTPGSPAVGAGAPMPASSKDRHGESRLATTPDIGADQYLDNDSDALADWWEISNFGNLSKIGTDDNDVAAPDRLTNSYEYLLGFDPKNKDTWENLRGDLFNAVFGSINDPWYPAEWLLDPDLDGLTNGQELYYGTSPTLADTNGDGISDKEAIYSGISATNTDTDNDGILNSQEIINGTSPFLKDSDGDGVNDNLDAFPLDPTRSTTPTISLPDSTPPQIYLTSPENATPY